MDLALEVATPKRKPPQQTVAPESADAPAPPPRGKTAERPPPASAAKADRTGNSGVFRQPEPPEYKAPREGYSNLILWAFAGLGVLAVIGSAVRFLRSGSSVPASAVGASAAPAADPTVWKPVELGPNVLVTIDISPRSARLLLDGEPLASNPVPLPRGSKHTIGGLADGFEGGLMDVVADKRKTVRMVLRPSKKRR